MDVFESTEAMLDDDWRTQGNQARCLSVGLVDHTAVVTAFYKRRDRMGRRARRGIVVCNIRARLDGNARQAIVKRRKTPVPKFEVGK